MKSFVVNGILVLLGVGCAFWALAYFYDHARDPDRIADLPLIRADSQPFKRAPSESIGHSIPYREKELYGRLRQDDTEFDAGQIRFQKEAEWPLLPAATGATGLSSHAVEVLPVATPEAIKEPSSLPNGESPQRLAIIPVPPRLSRFEKQADDKPEAALALQEPSSLPREGEQPQRLTIIPVPPRLPRFTKPADSKPEAAIARQEPSSLPREGEQPQRLAIIPIPPRLR